MGYILYGAAIVFVFAAVAGVVWAYVQRGRIAGTWGASHMSWLIGTFWWGLAIQLVLAAAGVVAISTWATGPDAKDFASFGAGFLVYMLAWLAALGWYLYRVIRGGVRALRREAV